MGLTMTEKTPLCDLCVKYGTDKVIWGYTPFYHTAFDHPEVATVPRLDVKRVLEIGICGHRDIPNNVVGASLFVWRDYFPNAEIYGLDNDSKWIFNDQDRIHTRLCDAYNPTQLFDALEAWENPTFDFICDDAVHDPVPQINLLRQLWSFLKRDGIYAIEDVCPYKLPDGNLDHMLKLLPPNAKTTVVHTHKDEKLLLIRRC